MKRRISMVLAVLVIATATTAGAQTEIGASSLGTQLAIELESGSDMVRADALQRIVETAAHHKEFDLSPAVPSLEEVYRSDPNQQYRLMALAALYEIGDRSSLWTVRRNVKVQTDRRVQIASIAAVCETFGTEAFQGDREVGRMARHLLATR